MRILRRRCFVILRWNRTRKKLFLLVAVCCLMFYFIPFVFNVELNHKFPNIYKRGTSSTNKPVKVNSGAHGNPGGKEAGGVRDLSQVPHPKPTVGTSEGKLNLHQWNICGAQVNTLRYWPFFPCLPDKKTFVTTFEASTQGRIGQRIFGYINPPSTGKYQFVLTSPCCSELWLSTDEDPRKVRLIAAVHNNSTSLKLDGHYTKIPAQISGQIGLTSGQKYFIEALYNGNAKRGRVTVLWKQPAIERFTEITEPLIHPYCPDIVPEECGCVEDELRELWHIPSHAAPTIPPLLTKEEVEYFYQVNYFPQEYLRGLLDVVPYNPTYVVKNGNVRQYRGIKIANKHVSSVYPEDDTWIVKQTNKGRSSTKFSPNVVLEKALAQQVVQKFLSALEMKYKRRFSLEKIIRLEGKGDRNGGMRFFLELKLRDNQENQFLRLAEHVISYSSRKQLGFPEGFLTWRRDVVINFILPVKNQAKWVKYFLIEMTKLYRFTGDENFHLVVIDFESTDGDIDQILEDSPLAEKSTLLKKSGPFHKTLALTDAVASVSDPNSIVFLFDLHITVPVTLLDLVRKHTIQSKTAFLPVVARLSCGFSPESRFGRWETLGSGLMAVFKSDWDRFGGMDIEKYKNRWGGEDWDLLDRILRVGLESERLKVPGFYHYFHNKKGMWQYSKTKKDPA